MGNAIMSFYSALIDLLGRCAPEMHVCLIEFLNLFRFFHRQIYLFSLPFALLQLINKGKGEALRIRAILRSLVPTEDLVGIISIPLKMPITNKGTAQDGHSNNMQQHTLHLYPSIRGHLLFIYMLLQDVQLMQRHNGYESLHSQCKADSY